MGLGATSAAAMRSWVLPDEPVPVRLMNTIWADPPACTTTCRPQPISAPGCSRCPPPNDRRPSRTASSPTPASSATRSAASPPSSPLTPVPPRPQSSPTSTWPSRPSTGRQRPPSQRPASHATANLLQDRGGRPTHRRRHPRGHHRRRHRPFRRRHRDRPTRLSRPRLRPLLHQGPPTTASGAPTHAATEPAPLVTTANTVRTTPPAVVRRASGTVGDTTDDSGPVSRRWTTRGNACLRC